MIKRQWILSHKNHLEMRKLRFASWWHGIFPAKYCWADCVTWVFDPRKLNPFKIGTSKGCEQESIDHDHKMCYCGQWQNGKCWANLSQLEQEQIREDQEANVSTELPF